MKILILFSSITLAFFCITQTADNNCPIEYSTVYSVSQDNSKYRIDVLKKVHPQHTHPECIGHIVFSIQNQLKKTGDIDRLFVQKEHRHNGYGSELFKKAIAFLLDNQYTIIRWVAAPTEIAHNTPEYQIALQKLVRFYEKLGGGVYYKALLYSNMQYHIDSKDFS